MNIAIIETELKRRGWSKYRLAKELKVRPNTLYTNLQKGSFRTVKAISDALNIRETDLIIEG